METGVEETGLAPARRRTDGTFTDRIRRNRAILGAMMRPYWSRGELTWNW